MDKVIVTVLLIIGGVVASFAVFNGIYPALQRSSSAINTATSQIDDQIKSQIQIINTSTNETDIHVWVKNTGASIIGNIQDCDVFLTNGSIIDRFTYSESEIESSWWNYSLTGSNSIWGPSVTNEIVLHPSQQETGLHEVKIVIPNGVSDQAAFGD